ncbi:MAG: acyltransferase [Gemmatimonadetes bacterium]|nr:acyltransferase [Gemmatimonadota bacterium]
MTATPAARAPRATPGWRRLRTWLGNLWRGVPLAVLRRAGPGLYVGPFPWFRPGEDIRLGRNVYIGSHLHLSAPCEIRDDVLLASYVSLVGGDHRFDQPGVLLRESGRGTMQRIVVAEDAWVGHGAILLGGVTIGRGAIVAAGSVVTSDVPPCEIWGGVPARRLKSRFDSADATARHLEFLRGRHGG